MPRRRIRLHTSTTARKRESEREYENANWMSSIMAKRARGRERWREWERHRSLTIFFFSFSLSRRLIHGYSKQLCARKEKEKKTREREREKEEFKWDKGDKLRFIYTYTCRRAVTICTARTIVYLLAQSSPMSFVSRWTRMNRICSYTVSQRDWEFLCYNYNPAGVLWR